MFERRRLTLRGRHFKNRACFSAQRSRTGNFDLEVYYRAYELHLGAIMDKPVKPAVSVRRRDATGHLDPEYAAGLLAHRNELAGSKDDAAFFPAAIRRDA